MYSLLKRMYPEILDAHNCMYFLLEEGFVLLCDTTDLTALQIDDELKTKIQQQIDSNAFKYVKHTGVEIPKIDMKVFVNLIANRGFKIIAIRVSGAELGYFDTSIAACKNMLDGEAANYIRSMASDDISIANRLLDIFAGLPTDS